MSQRKGNISILIAHRARGQSVASSARAAGMSPKTAARRLAEPAVRHRLAIAADEVAVERISEYQALERRALAAVTRGLTCGDTADELKAASIALTHVSAVERVRVEVKLAEQGEQMTSIVELLEKVASDG